MVGLLVPAITPAKVEQLQTTMKEAIKDKPFNLGIKPITDRDTWIDAKKVINAHLC